MDKKIQLFMLSYAGGSSLSFIKLSRLLDKTIEIIPVEYAGRGSRSEEPFIMDYRGFIDDVVSCIKRNRRQEIPYSIFGYSMGSALAFDICSNDMLGESPVHAFFCAEGSLLVDNGARKYGNLSEDEFTDRILQLGGIDNRLRNNDVILKEYLKLIRNDFLILGQYKYNYKKVNCNTSIIFSPKDTTCIKMDDWSKIINGKIDYYEIGNDHFFINQYYKEVAQIVNNVLLKI